MTKYVKFVFQYFNPFPTPLPHMRLWFQKMNDQFNLKVNSKILQFLLMESIFLSAYEGSEF